MPHAFPQDTFSLFSSNFANNYAQAPDWFLRNKKLPGLSGFVTLGTPRDFGTGDGKCADPEFEKMDIQSLVHQDFNFNLGKIFEENDPVEQPRRESGSGLSFEGTGVLRPGNHVGPDRGSRRQSFVAARKSSKSQDRILNDGFPVPGEKMSFFKGYLPMLLEQNWKEVLENARRFFEFDKEFDAQKNGENLLYLEDHKEMYGNAFENIYHSHYIKVIEKLRECVEGYSLTGETIIKLFHDELCSLISEMFHFLKNCTSDYCFDLMKNKSNSAKNNRSNTNKNTGTTPNSAMAPNASLNVPIPVNQPMNLNGMGMGIGLLYQERAQAQQKQPQNPFPEIPTQMNQGWMNSSLEENKADLMMHTGKDLIPAMSIENMESLAHLIDYNVGRKEDTTSKLLNNATNYRQIEGNSVAPSEIESSASENVRRLQRKYWSAAELQELDNLSDQYYPNNIPVERLDEFARRYGRTMNAVQSKISKTKKEKIKKNSETFQVDLLPGGSRCEAANIQRRYEVPVEKMIKGALQQFPESFATKDEIIKKIKEMYFRDSRQSSDEKLKNSISQTLSSSKSITSIKGTYRLRSRSSIITNVEEARTMKSRLQYILSIVTGNVADIRTIRKLYWDYFYDTVDNDKVWETSITKILKQSPEFDTSGCKSKYCLITNKFPE